MIKSFNTPAMQYRRAQAGITLIEVSIGLIIAAIIAAAAFIAFQNNSRRQEVRENVSAITEISSEARNKFVKTGRATELTDANALLANLFEPIGGQLNSYGGAVTFTAAPTAADRATLTWTAVEEDQCPDLATALFENFAEITVGTTDITPANTIAEVQGACVVGGPTTLVINL